MLLAAAAGLTVLVGHLVGLEGAVLSGVYAGALTNTPALAASLEQLESTQPVVGYSVTYLGGVLGMLIAAGFAVKVTAPAGVTDPSEAPVALERGTVRIDVDDLPGLDELAERYGNRVVFSRPHDRRRAGHPGTLDLPSASTRPQRGDILTVIGDAETVAAVIDDLGHPSTVRLVLDRSQLDFRRIAVSNRRWPAARSATSTCPTASARPPRACAAATSTCSPPTTSCWRSATGCGSCRRRRTSRRWPAYLGDSERGATDINPIGLFLGLGLGVLAGLLALPLPGGAKISLGVAGGPAARRADRRPAAAHRAGAVVAAALGVVDPRPVRDALLPRPRRARAPAPRWPTRSPATSARACSSPVPSSRSSPPWACWSVPGSCAPSAPRSRASWPAPRPSRAVLAYANDVTKADPRVNLGYALVYPVAMIVKVVLAPILGRF